MHDIVMEQFESHINGNAPKAFYDHLDACPACRTEVEAMDMVSSMVRGFRSSEEECPEPMLGFYNRVSRRIVESQRKEAWGLFSPGADFFRRIAFASLLMLAVLGGFLVSREASDGGADGAAIMAQHDSVADHPVSADRDRLLVTLADYHD